MLIELKQNPRNKSIWLRFYRCSGGGWGNQHKSNLKCGFSLQKMPPELLLLKFVKGKKKEQTDIK